jgi:hypothetical protein
MTKRVFRSRRSRIKVESGPLVISRSALSAVVAVDANAATAAVSLSPLQIDAIR